MTDAEFEREQQGRLERRLDAAAKQAGCLLDGCLIGLLPMVACLVAPAWLLLGH